MKKKITLFSALIPVVFLIIMLFFNVKYVFGNEALSGSNQFILILTAAVASIVGIINGVDYKDIMHEITDNIRSTANAIIILLMVGALTGSWLISGIVPAMIYYGLQILDPSYFLIACVLISSIVSVATGSSWTTSATIGVALVTIGKSMGIDIGMTAGAVISGAYFGDKLSPLSDTTNLAPALAGSDLYTHIKYMSFTTVPSILITLIIFSFIGFNLETTNNADVSLYTNALSSSFNITPLLFIVPAIVIGLIIKKIPPVAALLAGSLLGVLFAIIFQQDLLKTMAGNIAQLDLISTYKVCMNALTVDTSVNTGLDSLDELLATGGMNGMWGTIWLIICAMIFGGAMEAIGALNKISESLLHLFSGILGLFTSTVFSCLAINITAADQYLSIVVPGKMFAKAYKEKGLAPENLSRTLEDAGTVTSVLIPWNTCGAYQSKVLLGEAGLTNFIPYAFFNIISPFMTILFAAFRIKIRMLKTT